MLQGRAVVKCSGGVQRNCCYYPHTFRRLSGPPYAVPLAYLRNVFILSPSCHSSNTPCRVSSSQTLIALYFSVVHNIVTPWLPLVHCLRCVAALTKAVNRASHPAIVRLRPPAVLSSAVLYIIVQLCVQWQI